MCTYADKGVIKLTLGTYIQKRKHHNNKRCKSSQATKD